jgi:hypothetical protein
VRCAYCDAALYVDRNGLLLHYQLPRLLDREQTLAQLRRWMAGNETIKDLDRKASLGALHPISFPVWMFRVAGERGERVRIEPAAPTPIAQLADLAIPAGALEPYDESAADPDTRRVAAEVPLSTALGWLGDGASRVRESALVRLPLWEAHYRYQDRAYTALIDGSTGEVVASVYPAKAESPFVVAAALGLLVFGAFGIAISNPIWKLAAYLAAAVPVGLVAYWVAHKS